MTITNFLTPQDLQLIPKSLIQDILPSKDIVEQCVSIFFKKKDQKLKMIRWSPLRVHILLKLLVDHPIFKKICYFQLPNSTLFDFKREKKIFLNILILSLLRTFVSAYCFIYQYAVVKISAY